MFHEGERNIVDSTLDTGNIDIAEYLYENGHPIMRDPVHSVESITE